MFQRIRDLREERGLTLAVCAQKLGYTPGQYLRYEVGQTNMPLDCLIKLSNLYQVPTDYLLGLTDERE